MHTEKPDGQLPCNQLPLAAIAPSAEHDEWRNALTSADGSLDVSATLQQAFLITDTGTGVAKTSGMSAASYRQLSNVCITYCYSLRVLDQLATLPQHIPWVHEYTASLPYRTVHLCTHCHTAICVRAPQDSG